MCNRYKLKAKPDELIDFFDLPSGLQFPDGEREFFPGRQVPIILWRDDVRQLRDLTWGFPSFKGNRPINNTRSERAAASPFWSPHLNNRCIFPMTAAVEWQHRPDPATGELLKVPHAIGFADGRVAAVAGIYNDDQTRCSMMTCRANKLWAQIHNSDPDDPRMVCFLLDKHSIETWLDPSKPYKIVRELLRPAPDAAGLLTAHQI